MIISRSREPGGVRGEARRPGLARPRGRLCSEATPNPRSGAGLSAAGALAGAILRPSAGGASRRPPESLRPAPCEPPAPGQNRPARLRAARSRAVAPAHHAAAGLLVIFAGLLAVSTTAQAQTPTTFVSNTGEIRDSNADKILAQSFRTGDYADGYTVSDVQIWMAETAGKKTQIRIRESANNEPGSTVAFVANPSSLVANSLNTFATNTTLAANTTYWITVNKGVSDSTRAQFATIFSNEESGAAGWSIGNTRLRRESQTDDWSTTGSALLIAIRGTTDTTNNAPVFADGRSTTRAFQEDIVPGSVFGAAINASDADGDALTYTLEGQAAALFILNSNRRLRTKVGEDYSYETKSTHYLTIKADDNNGGITTIDVTVEVGDVDEQPDTMDKPTVKPVDNWSSRLTISWTKPGLGGGPDLTRYEIRAKRLDGDWSLVYVSGASSVSLLAANLAANTVYKVQIRTQNGEINGEWSDDETGKTNPVNDRPVFADGTDTSHGFDENTGPGTAFGRTIDATDPDGDTLTYTVAGTDQASFDIDANRKLVTKAGTSFDHETQSEYSVKMEARDDKGGVARIDVTVTVRDVDEPPDAPEMPTVATETGTSVSVTWMEPSNTGKPDIESYDVRYRKQGETPWADGPLDIPSTTTTTVITGLDLATIYEVQVRATNDDGDSAWSEAGEGTTTTPPAPGTTLVSNVRPTLTSGFNFSARTYIAQSFVVGGAATLTSVEIHFFAAPSNKTVAVTLNSPDSGGQAPGAKVADLTLSGTLSTGANTFNAPSGTELSTGTYWVVVERTDLFGAGSGLRLGAGDGPESTALTGWSIADNLRCSSNGMSWSTWNIPFSMAVKGTGGGVTNTPATGKPSITGAAQVGKTLEAETSGIMDADGVPSSFTYQWLRVDSDGVSNETNVGSNSNTYTLLAADVGKKIRVKVSFTDNAGNSEGPLTSAAYPSNAPVAAADACPTDNDWCSTLTVGLHSSGDIKFYGFTPTAPIGALANTTITYGDKTWTVSRMIITDYSGPNPINTVQMTLDTHLPRGSVFDLGGMTFTADAASVT